MVGRLQLVVQAMGLGEAKKVGNSIRDIETAAKRLSAASWGSSFQRQIEKIGVGARQIDEVRKSWGRLERDMSSRGLSKALQKSEIAAWKTATLSHLAGVRAGMRETEADAKRIGRGIQTAMKPAYLMLGGYTGTYIGSMAGREALIPASEGRRVQAEAKYSGLSEAERGRINSQADFLSGKYRLSKSQIYEVMKEASLSMPSTDAALAVSEKMARAFLVLSNMSDAENAIGGLRAFNRAMDNIEKVTPKEYGFFLENFMKAQQVAGKDIDPDAYAQALKYSRSSGKVYGDEFLSQWLPFLIAETGGSDAGTQIRAAFDQFIVGRASKKAIKAQEEYGIRGADGQLVGGDRTFTTNPIKWVKEHLIPQLQKSGVDMTDETSIAKVLGEVTNNRLSSDLLSRIVFSFDQYQRLVEQRMPNAAGLDAADQVQKDNSFAAWAGFKDSLKNLSDALLPMEQISGGLNSFADTINRFQQMVRDGDPRVATGLAAAGVAGGAFGAWKLASAVWGLITAGTALNAAAAALTAAAVAQGGPGVLGGGGGGKKVSGGFAGWVAALGSRAPLLSTLLLSGDTPGGGSWRDDPRSAAFLANQRIAASKEGIEERGRDTSLNGAMISGGPNRAGGIHSALMGGGEAIDRMLSGMDALAKSSATPTVDSSSIDEAIVKGERLISILRSAGAAMSASASNVDKELRRTYSDYGVAP
ncbi:hypothetical protein [Aminobacter sp. MSH1]|uniref:hypothetical protein n=1 Tax=Aminobacter sp. MSH1 TaxID=374606 RepID=UPI000D3E0329|nr:hypothetical protein [Aminobacter sp. MSH1]